ncbi:MAG: CHC2 zinc finger domain-containing protein [Thermoguttaceae bacterium]
MPAIDLAMLRSQVSIEQVLTLLGFVPSRRNGRSLRGPCPVHQSHDSQSRDFWVDLATNRYRCFKCHSAGRQLDLWIAVHHLSVHAAAEDLCRHLGIAIPWLASSRLPPASR